MKLEETINLVEGYFPNLQGQYDVDYKITSEDTPEYNCIAWAAGDTERWWWPEPNFSYWPPRLPKTITIANFIVAFEGLGYEVANSSEFEPNYEKVALYAKGQTPTHMARQLESGNWTSKLGPEHDISHTSLNDIEGDTYGSVVQILRRRWQRSAE